MLKLKRTGSRFNVWDYSTMIITQFEILYKRGFFRGGFHYSRTFHETQNKTIFTGNPNPLPLLCPLLKEQIMYIPPYPSRPFKGLTIILFKLFKRSYCI